MRRLLLLVPIAVALGACGERERTPPLAPVELRLSAPADGLRVDERTVEVRGAVVPADARVRVDGVEADVRGGAFSATVTLRAGGNVIDVQAAASRHPAAMTAVRVTRLVGVEVPELAGYEAGDAVDALDALGLQADVQSGFLDSILGDGRVCGTSPEARTRVKAGTTITVIVGRTC